MYTFLAPSSAFEARLIGKSIVSSNIVDLADYLIMGTFSFESCSEARTGKRSEK